MSEYAYPSAQITVCVVYIVQTHEHACPTSLVVLHGFLLFWFDPHQEIATKLLGTYEMGMKIGDVDNVRASIGMSIAMLYIFETNRKFIMHLTGHVRHSFSFLISLSFPYDALYIFVAAIGTH